MHYDESENKYDRVWALLFEASHIIYRLHVKELKSIGLMPRQAAALLYLQNPEEPMTAADMARLELRGRNSISVLLNRMEKEGLITKTPDPKNRKRQRLSLTGKGEKARKAAEWGKTIPSIFSTLSDSECQMLSSCLEKLLDRVNETLELEGKPYYIKPAKPDKNTI